MSTYLTSLDNKDFRIYLLGQTVSLFGTGMQSVALPWLVYKNTRSVLDLSMIAASGSLTLFFFSYLGGVFADKFDRRKYLIGIEILSLLQALVLTIMLLFNVFSIGLVLALGIIGGILIALEYSARHGFTIDLVGRENLVRGRALFGAINAASCALGSVAAALITWQYANGELFCFIANVLSYGFSILAMLKIRAKKIESVIKREETKTNTSNIWQCLNFAWINQLIWLTFVQTTVLAAFGARMRPLLPVFGEDVLHKGALGNGMLITGWALGQILGSLATIAFSTPTNLMKWATWSLIALPLTIFTFTASESLLLSIILSAFASFLIHVHVAICQTVLQHESPSLVQGRLFAIRAMLVASVDFGATFATAAAVNLWGPQKTILGCAVFCLAGTLLCFLQRIPLTNPAVQPQIEIVAKSQ